MFFILSRNCRPLKSGSYSLTITKYIIVAREKMNPA
jgi:hypothetical protein